MDFKLFFEPTEVDADGSGYSFQSNIHIYRERMPDHEGLDIALIGLNEYRGSDLKSDRPPAEEVRKQLYSLKKGFGKYSIIDLGNLRNGIKLEDTYLRIKEVCAYLLDKKIIPLLFGGSHDLDVGQFYAYENQDRLISMLGVDQIIDAHEDAPAHRSHLNKIFKHTPNFLFHYSHLAYQSYLADQKHISLIERLSFEAIRLGTIKENIREIEPMVREADLLSFDLSAIQTFYTPGAAGAKVYGLTGEEACQICWYAGQNEKMSSIGFYNYHTHLDSEDHKTAFVLGTMIWYFIEGFYHRKGDKNFIMNDYLLYEVHMEDYPESIRFFKSIKSDKWWMEIPNTDNANAFKRSQMIACSYSDYQKAQAGEAPDRWVNFLYKP